VPFAPNKHASRRKRKSGSILAEQSRAAKRSSNRKRVPLRERMPSIRQVGSALRSFARRSLPAVAIAGAVSLTLGGGYYGYQWMMHSERFAIAELNVSGQSQVSDDDVRALLALSANPNIFRADMGTLEARLEASPWIVSAEVSRDLPTGLDIVIHEEQAVAAVSLGALYLTNLEGDLFKRANLSNGEVDGLSVITGMTRETHLADPEKSQERLRAALGALGEFAKNAERPRIGELHLDERHGMSLVTFEDAIAIHIGTPESGELAERYRAFDSAWQALDAEEHAAARSFRIADRTPSDRVTVAFAGN
jgi:cell division protein FtsQ